MFSAYTYLGAWFEDAMGRDVDRLALALLLDVYLHCTVPARNPSHTATRSGQDESSDERGSARIDGRAHTTGRRLTLTDGCWPTLRSSGRPTVYSSDGLRQARRCRQVRIMMRFLYGGFHADDSGD